MKASSPGRGMLGFCLALFAASFASGAEIYKWVDENGRTHYSESKKEGDKANAIELKIKTPPPSAPSTSSPIPHSKDQESLSKRYPAQGPVHKPVGPPVLERPKSLSGGKADETNAANCNLARGILNGSMRHRNGMPTDAYDRQVAESDVRAFCR